ncbi:hypothetical protein F0U44_15530 [Nocardioides humilatus]|uniref:Flagellar assembly protein FliH/Type III secretion system HrpE domain-containing protein n=1 Tax=Nocardioides humilatus TaxID=2607660 RepID=A0A5B1LAP3_9ACTN|nr:FliH/SctL family protein [Nocardioides humilatus]KAA1417705.1 hypothetical protein F0U44_15530 [Nocardioides humilatus]
MTSTSSDRRERAVVLTADQVGVLGELATPELRTGHWTRLGEASLLGDRVTEGVLGDVAERVRSAATAEGYSVGWAQGRRDAAAIAADERRQQAVAHAAEETRREGEHVAAVEALSRAADDLRAQLALLADRVERQATDVAWRITEALVGREVAVATGPDVVRRVLAVLPTHPLVRVRLHPELAADPAVRELTDHGVEIVGDPHLGRADALVEADGSVVDLRIDQAMGRVHAALFAPTEVQA